MSASNSHAETTPPAATAIDGEADVWSPNWTRPFRARDKAREARLFWITLAGIASGWVLALTLQRPALALLIGAGIGAAFYVRLYSMFHEHAHGVFLDARSFSGTVLCVLARALMVTDIHLWQKGHQRHHEEVGHFGVLLPGAIGIVSAEMYVNLSPGQQKLYQVFRHPAFLFIFGYFTIFIAYFNLLPLASRSRRRWNGLLTLLWHGGTVALVSALAGPVYGIALVILPAVVGAVLGVMVFYLQHIFPGADYRPAPDSAMAERAWASSSQFQAPRWILWCLGDQEHHHLHHLDPVVPFYRRAEACATDSRLQARHLLPLTWHSIRRALDCFVWDAAGEVFLSKREIESRLLNR